MRVDTRTALVLPTLRITYALSAITAALTPQQAQYLPRVEKRVGEALVAVNALLETDVPAFNRLLLENGHGLLDGGTPIR